MCHLPHFTKPRKGKEMGRDSGCTAWQRTRSREPGLECLTTGGVSVDGCFSGSRNITYIYLYEQIHSVYRASHVTSESRCGV